MDAGEIGHQDGRWVELAEDFAQKGLWFMLH